MHARLLGRQEAKSPADSISYCQHDAGRRPLVKLVMPLARLPVSPPADSISLFSLLANSKACRQAC